MGMGSMWGNKKFWSGWWWLLHNSENTKNWILHFESTHFLVCEFYHSKLIKKTLFVFPPMVPLQDGGHHCQPKPGPQTATSTQYFLITKSLLRRKIIPLKHVVDETEPAEINCIKSWLKHILFHLLAWGKGKKRKSTYQSEIGPGTKHLCDCELQAELTTFFMENNFYL